MNPSKDSGSARECGTSNAWNVVVHLSDNKARLQPAQRTGCETLAQLKQQRKETLCWQLAPESSTNPFRSWALNNSPNQTRQALLHQELFHGSGGVLCNGVCVPGAAFSNAQSHSIAESHEICKEGLPLMAPTMGNERELFPRRQTPPNISCKRPSSNLTCKAPRTRLRKGPFSPEQACDELDNTVSHKQGEAHQPFTKEARDTFS